MPVKKAVRLFMKMPVWLYLRKSKISCKCPPLFSGKWPRFVNKGKIIIGERCVFREFRKGSRFSTLTAGAFLEIGSDCFFNDGVNICATKKIVIKDHCKLADNVMIYDTNFHHIQEGDEIVCAEVVISRNVWIGAGAIILPGVKIGEHSVIGAGSVVTHDIPAKVVAAGNPAKVIRSIECGESWIRE